MYSLLQGIAGAEVLGHIEVLELDAPEDEEE